MGYTGEFQMSLTSRFRMLDELSKDKKKPVYSAIVKEGEEAAQPQDAAGGPQLIEDQLKGTDGKGQKVARVRTPDEEKLRQEEEKPKKKKGGFLSRFRR